MRRDLFDAGQNQLIERLLAVAPPIVAALEAVPDEVIGWTCRGVTTTHYVYVKHDFRRIGIGSLLAGLTLNHTHRTRIGELFFRKIGSQFNPFALMGA